MKFIFTYLFLFSLAACVTEEDIVDKENFSNNVSNISQESVWICHNLESEHHGKQCFLNDSEEPCLERGNQSKFCWQLDVKDCFDEKIRQNIEFCKDFL